MLYARAATKVLSEGGDLHDGQAVTVALRSTSFEGARGLVSLNENGDRINSYDVMNYVVGVDGALCSVLVGIHDSLTERFMPNERLVVWPGNTTEVPADYFSGAHCSTSI